jgi:hypothetical protein
MTGLGSLTFTPEYETVRSDTEVRMTFNVNLLAPEIGEDQKRATVSLTSVLDKSGSMEGSKLQLVKSASKFMLGHLSERDKHGVIEYDSGVNELIPLSKTSAGFKPEAERVIASIRSGTTTNLSGGLFMGIEQQRRGTFVDWDTLFPLPTAPSWPPSEMSSYVDVDDVASVMSVDSDVSVPADAPAPERKKSGWAQAFQGLWRGAAGTTSAPEPAPALQTPPKSNTQLAQCKRRLGRVEPVPLFGGKLPLEKQAVEDDAVRSVFLFTDGMANEGVTNPEQLVSMVRKMVDAKPCARVFTFGFGSDHDENLLRALAEAGSGCYYFIEKEDYIATAFADAMGGLLSTAAQNAGLRFVPAPGVVVEEVLTSFATNEETRGENVETSVRIGDLMSEESKDTLFNVRLPALPSADVPEGGIIDYKIGHVEASFVDVNSADIKCLQVECMVKRSREESAAAANHTVSVQRARFETVRALEEARTLADQGRFDASKECLKDKMRNVEALVESAVAAQEIKSAGLASVLRDDLAKAIEHTASETVFRSKGRKKMAMKSQSRGWQRSANCADSSDEEEESDFVLELQNQCGALETDAAMFLAAKAAVSNFKFGSKNQQRMRGEARSSCR